MIQTVQQILYHWAAVAAHCNLYGCAKTQGKGTELWEVQIFRKVRWCSQVYLGIRHNGQVSVTVYQAKENTYPTSVWLLDIK